MAMVACPGGGYTAEQPPPQPSLEVVSSQLRTYDGNRGADTVRSTTTAAPLSRVDVANRGRRHQQQQQQEDGGQQALDGIVLLLRAAVALSSFVAMALVASCRHGDWMEFPRYQEYRYLLGVSVVASLYSTAQAIRDFRRMRRGGGGARASFLDFAGDQAVAYLVVTASAAAVPITMRMRSAVVNVFTDAIAASIALDFIAFAALAFSAILSGCKLSRQTHY